MNGIEFLEQAMDLFPRARRVLLTAYADTDAAIQAINVVDVDHYLLKPWDPPEEKLYPVVDELIGRPGRTTGDRRGRGDQGRRPPLVGAARTRCATSSPATGVPYRWYSADEPEGAAAAGRRRLAPTPTSRLVLTPDGERAASPDRSPSWRPRSGWRPRPAGDFYDLVDRRRRAGRARRRGLRRLRGPADRAGRARGDRRAGRPELAASRTTSASPTASPAASSPTGPAARRPSSGPSCSPPARSSGLDAARAGARACSFERRHRRSAAHAVVLATGVSLPAAGRRRAPTSSSGAASSTARRPPRRRAARASTSYIVGGANSAGQAAVFFSRYAARVHARRARRPT